MTHQSWLPLAAILLPMLAAPATAAVYRSRSTQAWVSLASLQLVLIICLWLLTFAAGGQIPTANIAAATVLETRFELILAVDALSALLLVLLAGIALANVGYYVARSRPAPERAYQEPLLLMSLATTMATLAAGNLLTLYTFWQLSIVSFTFLAATGPASRSLVGAVRYFIVNELAALALLIALGLWYGAGTPSDLAGWVTVAEPMFRAGVAILLVAAGVMASGGFPFQTGVTASSAFTAPSAFSYVLSASNIVGLYLLARFAIAQTDGLAVPQAAYVVVALGAATVLFGGLLALAHVEPKRILVDASLLPVGFALIAVAGGPLGVTAVVILIVARAVGATTAVFGLDLDGTEAPAEGIAAGRWLDRHQALLAAGSYALGAATLVGLPPLPGYLGQSLGLHALFAFDPRIGGVVATVAISGSLMAAVAVTRLGARTFLITKAAPEDGERSSGKAFSTGTVAALVAICLVGALFPALWIGSTVAPIAGTVVTGSLAELAVAATERAQPIVLWELALTIVILAVPGAIYAATIARGSETALVAREEVEHRRDYGDLVGALSYTGRPAPDPAATDVHRRWPAVATWLRAGRSDVYVLGRAIVMPAARIAAGGIRLTSRLFLR